MRVVFDTNVLVSALLLHESTSRRAFDRALDRGQLLLSLPTLSELAQVLARPKFRRYISQDSSRRFLAALTQKAEWVEIREEIQVCRDPKDDKFLDLAVNGLATHLVTGDHDLISLTPFRSVAIVSPADFLSAAK